MSMPKYIARDTGYPPIPPYLVQPGQQKKFCAVCGEVYAAGDMPRLLLLSNSRNPGCGYMEHALPWLDEFLAPRCTVAFVPWAAVTVAWDAYETKVVEAFEAIGRTVESVHHGDNPAATLGDAGAIAVGGGNTFQLLEHLRKTGALTAIRQRVEAGVPYIGWSAGSNVASPTICTTNDMPIVDPGGFEALGLVSYQINPHYTNERIPNHGGEARDDRIAEFLAANPEATVLALPEGTAVHVDGDRHVLLGEKPARMVRNGLEAVLLAPGKLML